MGTEGNQNAEKAESKFNRRSFLKRLAVGTAVVVAGGKIGSEQISQGETGIQTDLGTFIPLYERHDVGIRPDQIPVGLDIFYREMRMDRSLYDSTPSEALQKVLQTEYEPISQDPQLKVRKPKMLPQEIMTTLAKNRTSLMFGDVSSYDLLVELGEPIASLGILAVVLNKMIRSREQKITRKKFLEGLGVVAASWGLSRVFSDASLVIADSQKNAIGRIITRINGLQSHLHPERNMIFFRNAMMALRMMTVAEKLQGEKNRKIRMGFNVGAAHSGIEDFLMVGPEICRLIVLAYPAGFLKNMAEKAGTVENFSSAFLFELPTDLTESVMQSGEGLNRVIRRKITDEKLVQALEQKLAG